MLAHTILYLISVVTLLFCLSLAPLQLAMALLIMGILFCVMVATMLSSWTAYLLFLVYIGGILVLFMFMIFLSTNQLMKGSWASSVYIYLGLMIMAPWSVLVDLNMKNSLGHALGVSLFLEMSVWGLYVALALLIVFLGVSEALDYQGRIIKVSYE
uniref:NADH dehydrogenase subunit 6 n=1 Tax=Cerion coloni TaxID=2894307 RepID=A0A8K2ARA3_9EUPU|nr:NADH dehydrogenase subunit 6 [Cerion coloni]UEQ12587.1 NADH dehydrogenase subunit 6 [Cerion coloni]